MSPPPPRSSAADLPLTGLPVPRPTADATGPGRARRNARGQATRELMLVTAERLFAERGIESVPLRDIAVAAGARNNVAVQYHFGDRETLVRAVAAHRAAFVDDVQAKLLGESLATGEPPRPIDHVRLFVESLAANVAEDDNHYIPFLSRYLIERGGYAGLFDAVPATTVLTLRSLLRHLLRDLDPATIQERWEVVMSTTVHTLARYQRALAADNLPAPLVDLVEDLVRFLAAGLAAPADA
jgi:AcrR family transcriptional regulator